MDGGITQEQLASKLGVKETTVYNWEKNRTKPVGRAMTEIITFIGQKD